MLHFEKLRVAVHDGSQPKQPSKPEMSKMAVTKPLSQVTDSASKTKTLATNPSSPDTPKAVRFMPDSSPPERKQSGLLAFTTKQVKSPVAKRKTKKHMSYRANMNRFNIGQSSAIGNKFTSIELLVPSIVSVLITWIENFFYEVIKQYREFLILKSARLFKASLSIENAHFQGELLYKEVEVKGYLKSGATERLVLRLMAKAPTELLEEVLMSNPSCLGLYSKASLYMRIVAAIQNLLHKKFLLGAQTKDENQNLDGMIDKSKFHNTLEEDPQSPTLENLRAQNQVEI